jgi:hypothetical protein
MAIKTFCRLEIGLQTKTGVKKNNYFVVGFWEETSFRLQLTDGKMVWEGEASSEYVRTKMCPPKDGAYSTGERVKAFLDLLRQSLVAPTAGTDRFRYSIEGSSGRDDTSLDFKWDIKLEDDGGKGKEEDDAFRLAVSMKVCF